MSRTVLVLSPHLDDAAFSCGGTMALLADAGWSVWLATVFTRSVHPAEGFALACQLDKGLPPEVDYMALRREEDRAAGAQLEVAELRWMDLLEAPHRGYGSASALFGAIGPGDEVWREVAAGTEALLAEARPEVVLAPQGLGGHVDHRQVIRAVRAVAGPVRLAFYRDTPYAIRDPGGLPIPELCGMQEGRVGIEAGLSRKIAASCAYRSQVGFQFGSAEAAEKALRAFAMAEGEGQPAERFLGDVPRV